MPERAFVAGATGYTGREVVRVLRERGVETVAHVRPDSPSLSRWQTEFGALGAHPDATPWTLEAMRARLGELSPSVVFALLGTTRARKSALAKHGGDPESATYEAVDYELTALLLTATHERCPAARFVYLSAMGVSPNASAGSSYTGVRARVEALLRETGQPCVVARPAFISGEDREEDRPLERVAARTSDALLGVAAAFGAKRLNARLRSLSARELASGLVSAALDPRAEGRVLGPAELRERA